MDRFFESFTEAVTYLESQGMRICGAPRFSYVDGPWNQDDPCELQPDYVVLTLPVGKAKTHQENPSRKPIKKTHQENPSRNSKMSSKVEAKIKLILEFCSEPKSFIEIMEHIGLKDRVSFKRLYIQRMLDEGLLKMTNPDNPTSRNQMYVTQK